MILRKAIVLLLALSLFSASAALAASLEGHTFVKASAQDQKAVVKTPKGELRLVEVGEALSETLRIIEIAEGRVVLERPGEYGTEVLIVRLEQDGQKIDRMQVMPLRSIPEPEVIQ